MLPSRQKNMSHEAIEKHQWFVLHSEVTSVHRDSSSWFYIWECTKRIKLCSCILCPLIKTLFYIELALLFIVRRRKKRVFKNRWDAVPDLEVNFAIWDNLNCSLSKWFMRWVENHTFSSRQGFSRERCCCAVTQMDQLPHQLHIDLLIEFLLFKI